METLFIHPLYQWRYNLLLKRLSTAKVKYVAWLDIGRDLLEAEARHFALLPVEWLNRREQPVAVELYYSSCGDSKKTCGLSDGRVEGVTSIQQVEHLD